MNTQPKIAPPEERSGMMLAHLLGLLLGVLGALIYWILNKDKDETPFVQDQAKEVLNFHLNILILITISGILCLVLIGFILLPLVAVASFVLSIIGTIRANNGESYRYPFIIRLIK